MQARRLRLKTDFSFFYSKFRGSPGTREAMQAAASVSKDPRWRQLSVKKKQDRNTFCKVVSGKERFFIWGEELKFQNKDFLIIKSGIAPRGGKASPMQVSRTCVESYSGILRHLQAQTWPHYELCCDLLHGLAVGQLEQHLVCFLGYLQPCWPSCKGIRFELQTRVEFPLLPWIFFHVESYQ